jgi:hypothetical protein
VPCFDRALTLYILRDNIARADALITAAEHLLEELDRGIEEGDEDEGGASISRRRNHVAHLIEGAKMAVRAAICAGDELDRHGA